MPVCEFRHGPKVFRHRPQFGRVRVVGGLAVDAVFELGVLDGELVELFAPCAQDFSEDVQEDVFHCLY